MNCDQVFEVLTRGPFPTGQRSDAAVERHLKGCHECRQLAEALRPAVDLFHESLEAESEELPGYRGSLRRSSDALLPSAVMTAISRETQRSAETINSRSSWIAHVGVWRLAAAVVLAIALGVVLWSVTSTSTGAYQAVSPHAGPVRFQPDEEGIQTLIAMNLPSACLPKRSSFMELVVTQTSLGASHYACCTGCHSAGTSQRIPVDSIARVGHSCVVCHSN